jgi:hypothetical protein
MAMRIARGPQETPPIISCPSWPAIGNLAGFEEASRALFADDRRRFVALVAGWPDDIRDHVVKLAFSDRAEPP